MNNYEKNMNIVIPRDILTRELSDDVIVVLIKLFSYNSQYIKVMDVLSKLKITRDQLKLLDSLSLITIEEVNADLCINLSKYFENNLVEVKSNGVVITADFSDRINFLLSRSLKPLEVEKIISWLTKGYDESQIELALQKTVLKGVDNLSYTETVLFNSDSTNSGQKPTGNEVIRKVDIY